MAPMHLGTLSECHLMKEKNTCRKLSDGQIINFYKTLIPEGSGVIRPCTGVSYMYKCIAFIFRCTT